MKTVNISDAEWAVMQLVWAKAPLPAGEIVNALARQRGWRPRTTRTLLARLVKKQALKIRPDGKRYLYEPQISMVETVSQESRSFLDRVFGGEPAAMLLHLVGEARLNKEEIRRLKAILNQKEK